MNDPQGKGPPGWGGGSGYDPAPDPVAKRLRESRLSANPSAQNPQRAGQPSHPSLSDTPGSQAPKAPYGGPDPKELARLFQEAKDAGNVERANRYGRRLKSEFNWEYGEGPGGWPYILPHARSIVELEPPPTTRRLTQQELAHASEMEGYFNLARRRGQIWLMKDIGQGLKNSYGYEYGIGDGGWPYIKPPSDVVPIDRGMLARKEAVARQIAQDRAEREEREAAAHDTRSVGTRGAQGFFNALKAKFGDVEAGIGRGLQTVEELADYYKPEAVAARYLRRKEPPPAPSIGPREPYFGEALRGRGEDIATTARHRQDIYGQDLASQTGWVLGDATANVGAGMLGGPYGVGILDATAAYGRGEPLQQALGTGVISTASLEAGGGLGNTFAEKAAAGRLPRFFGSAGPPVARYLGRSTGYAVGPQAVSIPGTALVYGKPHIPDSAKEAALDIAQALGFGFLPDRRAAVKRIAIHPGTAPDVSAALHAILNGEIQPRGAPESLGNIGVRSGATSDDAGIIRTGAGRSLEQADARPGLPGIPSARDAASHPGRWQTGREYLGPYYAELKGLRAADPEFLPDPDKTLFRIVKGEELKRVRNESQSSGERGHHVHPLAHGGPAIPEPGGLAYTGERQIRKDLARELDWKWYPNKAAKKTVWHAPNKETGILVPGRDARHVAATNYWKRVERWQKASGMR